MTRGNEWISIEERKPPNDVYVLIARFDGRENVKMYFIQIAARMNDEWIDDYDHTIIKTKTGIVTHWMPLPEVPIANMLYSEDEFILGPAMSNSTARF